MAFQQGAFRARYGSALTQIETSNPKPQKKDDELFEILYSTIPDLPANMSKENKKSKVKKSHQLRRERAALKKAGHSWDDNPEHQVFVVNGGRNYNTGKTLMEFTIFNKLAPELREMVWKEALPGAQAVRITPDGFNFEQRPTLMRTIHRFSYRGKASYVPSPLLSVNRESREIVKKNYPLAFAAQLGGRPIRFNFKKDILYFECPSALINFYGGTLPFFNTELQSYGFVHDMDGVHDNVQHVAIGNIKIYKATIGATLNMFKVLKTVVLGGANGTDILDPNDNIVDYLTGDKRMLFGWERYQNFKTPEDGNMPRIERLRADEFRKLVDIEFKQIVRSSKRSRSRKFLPALVPKPISFMSTYFPNAQTASSPTANNHNTNVPNTAILNANNPTAGTEQNRQNDIRKTVVTAPPSTNVNTYLQSPPPTPLPMLPYQGAGVRVNC